MNKKILSKLELIKIVKRARRLKKKIILCHGVFDLVHLGHILHFQSAKKYGDILIVSITKDKFIKKGLGRPLFNEQQRLVYLSNLTLIDYVFLCETESAEESIKLIKPNFYIKGEDYKENKLDKTKKIVLEKKLVKSFGGKFVYTNERSFSSTNIINKSYSLLNSEQLQFIESIKRKFSYSDIKKKLIELNSLKVLVIGELIVDRYNFGSVIGKSAKEPHLVFKSEFVENYIGGSGAIARHIKTFVKNIFILTSFGTRKEDFYNEIVKELKGMDIYNIKNFKNFGTIVKERFIDKITGYKVFGNYTLPFLRDSSLNKRFIRNYRYLSKKSDVSILSDFGHYFFDKKIADYICSNSNFLCVNAQLNSSNSSHHSVSNYRGVNLLVVNESEIRQEVRDDISKIENIGESFRKKNNIKSLIITRGSNGSLMFSGNEIFYCPAFADKIKDKVGAGDAMLSIASLLLKVQTNPEIILLISSIASAKSLEGMGNKISVTLNDIDRFLEYTFK